MEEKEVDLRDYIRVIKKRKKIILLIFFVAIIVSAVLSFVLPPVYEVTSTIKIGKIVDVDTLEKEPIESQAGASGLLKSAQFLGEAIKELNLPFTIKELRKKISVEPIIETEDLIQIKIETKNPSQGLNIVNYLSEKLIQRDVEIKKKYESEEELLARYDEEINKISKELNKIEGNIKEMEKEEKSLEIASENVSREIEKRMEGSESLSEAESGILVGQMKNIGDKLEVCRNSIQSERQRYASFLKELREAQIEKAKIQRRGSSNIYNTEVLVSPKEPKEPIRPNKPLNIAVTAVISLLVGLGTAFSLEYFEKSGQNNVPDN